MILSDLLGAAAIDSDGGRVGRVIDARFELTGRTTPATATLRGLIVSPRSAASFLGYERTAASRPVIIDHLLSRMHRGSF
ncbi:MAG TPA: PRC-barrel domain containing protein, partial [Pseudolysinimonas sp.]|nr:PRC-barrel domain containing protein [Pseudolysinimonas sp.]